MFHTMYCSSRYLNQEHTCLSFTERYTTSDRIMASISMFCCHLNSSMLPCIIVKTVRFLRLNASLTLWNKLCSCELNNKITMVPGQEFMCINFAPTFSNISRLWVLCYHEQSWSWYPSKYELTSFQVTDEIQPIRQKNTQCGRSNGKLFPLYLPLYKSYFTWLNVFP